MPIEAKLYRSPESFRSLKTEWKKLIDAQGFPIFSYPEWYEAWWNVFGDKNRLLLFTVEEEGILIGLWPFCVRRSSVLDLCCLLSEPVTGSTADYHLPVIKKGREEVVLDKIISRLLEETGKQALLYFPHIPKGHSVYLVLRDILGKKQLYWNEKETLCPVLPFLADYKSTENQWKKSLRTDIRRQRKRLSERGIIRLCIPESRDEILKYLPVFFEMHNREWVLKGYNVKFKNPNMRDFYKNLVDLLYPQGLHFSYLLCGEDIVSMHMGFISNNWLFWYVPTYNSDFEKQSPSKVHLSYLIEEGLEKGWKGVDFLQGDEFYKLQWTSHATSTVSFLCSKKKGSIYFLWFTRVKPWILDKFR